MATSTSKVPHAGNDVENNANGTSTYGSFPAIDAHAVDAGPVPAIHQNGTSKQPGRKLPAARALAPDLLRGLLMAIMALDHNVAFLKPWAHETAPGGEKDSVMVDEWNRPVGFVIRMFTHLCAPGFTLLLGMGVVYFGRSRTKLGWSAGRMMMHFFIRGLLLTALTCIFGIALTTGRVLFFNMVLFQLAVDYVLVGALWLAMNRTEIWLAEALEKVLPAAEVASEDRQPLIASDDAKPTTRSKQATSISWHVHNVVLLVLAAVTIWWNIWLSSTHGRCEAHVVNVAWDATTTATNQDSVWSNPLLQMWWYPVLSERVFSGFPPMAWLAFAILGLLYGRVILANSWSKTVLAAGNAAAGLAFLVLFVFTRVFQFGNLSTDCLQMPEQKAHPGSNQYLQSVPSFLYLTKYPPDVAFLTYTIGVNLLLLSLLGLITPAMVASRVFGTTILKPLLAFGTSALFFYFAHMLLFMAMGLGLMPLFGRKTGRKDQFMDGDEMIVDSLFVFWANWVVALLILYPLCRWYGAFKRTKGPDSIWRFF